MDSGPKAILLISEFIAPSAQSSGDIQGKEENKEHHKESFPHRTQFFCRYTRVTFFLSLSMYTEPLIQKFF